MSTRAQLRICPTLDPITVRRRTLAAIGIVALLLSACGQSEGSEVLPFSDVQENEFVFEADPTNLSRGIFRVTTTEPMICAIVWGETEQLGNFNNSLAMNGTGIVEHDVFLPNAEPGVEYFFKVQGSTADGSLYESELSTFVIEPIEGGDGDGEQVDRGENLALGAVVSAVSSEFSDSFAADLAIDGNPDTEWSTAGNGNEAFITIDLGASAEIGGVEFVTRSMADGTATTTEFTVTIDDGEPLGPFPAGNLADPAFSALDAMGQLVRFDVVSSTGGNTGAVEVRVFAP